ncbi:MAG: hypothetical protein CL908_14245 [Deltaproteobacteria bacterium]|nr:hypothetical protein [Deltaproteobacteria bacterium]
MKSVLLALVCISGLVACSDVSGSGEGQVVVAMPWARASAGPVKTGVVYARLSNEGAEADQLISLSTPVAAEAVVHEVVRERNMISMRPLETVTIPAGEVVELEPGGLHVMLMQLRSPLVEGETFPMTFSFERAGAITVRVEVKGIAAMGAHDHG